MKSIRIGTSLMVIASSLVLASCSMTKEVYTRPPMSSQRLQNSEAPLIFHHEQSLEQDKTTVPNEVLASENWTPVVVKKLSMETSPMNVILPTKHRQPLAKGLMTAQPGDCDELILYGGEIINVKVLEINDNEIKYKKCDNLDGPAYIIGKSSVKGIHYANGTDETIKESANVKIAPLLQPDYLNMALLQLLYAGLSYLGAFLISLLAALLVSVIVFSILLIAVAYICVFVGFLFSIAFMVYYVCYLLKQVS